MTLKDRLASFINQILTRYVLTQRDLADLLEISPGRMSAYVKGRELPRVDIIIKLAELGGLTVDDLLKTEKEPEKKEIIVTVKGDGNITPIAGRDVHVGDIYQNTTVKRTYKYTYQPGDLTEEQAARLLTLVNGIVEMENIAKKKPLSHAAVWNALKKRFKVAYYRKIREEDFDQAEAYFKRWGGRLQRAKKFPKVAPDLFRKKRYAAIHAAAKNQLGWKKEEVNDYIFSLYGVDSIRDLTNDQLQELYNKIMYLKRKRKK